MSRCLREAMVGANGAITIQRGEVPFNELTRKAQALIIAGNLYGELIVGADHDAGELRSFQMACNVAGCAVACSLSANETGVLAVSEDVQGCELDNCPEAIAAYEPMPVPKLRSPRS